MSDLIIVEFLGKKYLVKVYIIKCLELFFYNYVCLGVFYV